MFARILFCLSGFLALAMPSVRADDAAPLSALAKMPVKEVTIFKDGHAMMLHEGRMPIEASGDVIMDYLPAPVLGTFWPYSGDKDVKLNSVIAGQRKVLVERTSLTIQELLEGNVGAEVIINEIPLSSFTEKPEGISYLATIVGLPVRSSKELETTAPTGEGEKLPEKGKIILLKTSDGVRAVAIDRIQQVTFRGQHQSRVANEEFRNLLQLKLDWKDRKPAKDAAMGLMYLQKGIRWIPNYKFTIDGKGRAEVQLEATIINEMTDLEDVTANLVVGVPSFAFAETADPMGLGQKVAQLSQYFHKDAQTQYAFSNAIMSQTARMGERINSQPAPPETNRGDLGPEIGGTEKNEDLYIFTLKHLTLRKGQRMVVPVAAFELKYEDLYTVEIGFAPPPEVWRNFNNQQQAEIAKLFLAPKATHKIRLLNNSKYPITTAPALILKEGQVLGQGMTTYTSPGGSLDLPVTTAVDISVKKSDREIKREHNAVNWEGIAFAKISLEGTLTIKNNRAAPTRIEVVRNVLGNATDADHDGKIETENVLEGDWIGPRSEYPYWWSWYAWPHWWTRLNSMGRITWKFDLEPGKSIDLKYQWQYFWH
jgi:hypothetical protein